MEKAYFISLMMDIRGGTLYRIYCPEDLDKVIRVDVPRFVIYHQGTRIYDQFENLRFINAHYASPCYESFDGCLYRKSGELLFIPMGKDAVRLSPSIISFDPAVFAGHDRLTRVEVPDGAPYVFRDGCLFNTDMTSLYFVTRETEELFIPASVDFIAKNVFQRPYGRVTAEQGNPVYSVRDGALYQSRPEGEVLLCVPEGTKALELPEGVSVSAGCLRWCHSLESVSLPVSARGETEEFESRREQVRFTLRLADGSELPLHLAGALSLKKALSLLESGAVEVRPGTEYFYLELYLRGSLAAPAQKRAMAVSAMQILSEVIRRDDADTLARVLRDGRLVTKRSAARLRRLAREENASRAAALLAEAGDLPEKIVL